MGKKLEESVLQREYPEGEPTYEKVLNLTKGQCKLKLLWAKKNVGENVKQLEFSYIACQK